MIVSSDLYQNGRRIGWFIYRASDEGGTMYITALRGHKDTVDRFVQNWHDHRSAIRNLLVAWTDELKPYEFPDDEASERQIPSFHVYFNEIVDPGDENHDPSIVGWCGIASGEMRFTGIAEIGTLENLIRELGSQNGVRNGIIAWAYDIVVENWDDPTDPEEVP